jgi:hypothetical protein
MRGNNIARIRTLARFVDRANVIVQPCPMRSLKPFTP